MASMSARCVRSTDTRGSYTNRSLGRLPSPRAEEDPAMGKKLQAAEVERHGPVGIVKIHPVERMMERSMEPDCDEFIEVHESISIALEELRFDGSIRIIIVTGSHHGVFYVA